MTGRAQRDIAYRSFHLPVDLPHGVASGVRAVDGGIGLEVPVGQLEHTDPHTGAMARYDLARWTAPTVRTGFPIREVVPSWTAETPDGCWIEVELRGWADPGPVTGWYVLGRWAADDAGLRRTSVPGQTDADAAVRTDVLVAMGAVLTGWQVRVTLLRPAGTTVTPVLYTVGAVASGPTSVETSADHPTAAGTRDHPPSAGTPADNPTPAEAGHLDADAAEPDDLTTGEPSRARVAPVSWGTVLDVPRFSQRVHAGHYPCWGGGGDSWCSPTATSMVLAYWEAGPTPDRYAWVDPTDPRPVVDHAARQCFDHAYAGTGNWAFNTAYAGRFGMAAFVTRLRSLAEAERFIEVGVPLVVSAAFHPGEVTGLDYDTAGHLMVLVGFTADGDPVLNDPYAPDDDGVRRLVPRQAFEAAWQRGSGGISYVIRPPSVPLPTPPAQANW